MPQKKKPAEVAEPKQEAVVEKPAAEKAAPKKAAPKKAPSLLKKAAAKKEKVEEVYLQAGGAEWNISDCMFVNISACPCAGCWNAARDAGTGKMFCEEFYPAYMFAAASPKAQVNVGRELVNDGDTFCRLSVYFRPANLPEEERGVYFDEFDPAYHAPAGPCPGDGFDYEQSLTLLHDCFLQCAGARLGSEGVRCVESAAGVFLRGE